MRSGAAIEGRRGVSEAHKGAASLGKGRISRLVCAVIMGGTGSKKEKRGNLGTAADRHRVGRVGTA